jgi:hypothetical protein
MDSDRPSSLHWHNPLHNHVNLDNQPQLHGRYRCVRRLLHRIHLFGHSTFDFLLAL